MHTGCFRRSPAVASMVQSWTSGTSIERRPHVFSQKTTLLREYCDVCAKRIGFGANTLKCGGTNRFDYFHAKSVCSYRICRLNICSVKCFYNVADVIDIDAVDL
jgi:hypothetical protein